MGRLQSSVMSVLLRQSQKRRRREARGWGWGRWVQAQRWSLPASQLVPDRRGKEARRLQYRSEVATYPRGTGTTFNPGSLEGIGPGNAQCPLVQPTDAKISDYLSENPTCSNFSSSAGSDYIPPPFSQAPNPLVNLQVHLATQPSLIFPPDYLSFIFLACATTGYVADSFLIHFHDAVSSPSHICILKRHTPYTHKTCNLVAITQALATPRSNCFRNKDQWYRSVNHDIK